jgi:hypothetical protein
MRLIQILIALLVVGAAVVYFNYGTIEPCGVLREQIRRHATAHGGDLGGLLAGVTPDNVINAMISTEYNRPMTPWLCTTIVTGIEHQPEIMKRQ